MQKTKSRPKLLPIRHLHGEATRADRAPDFYQLEDEAALRERAGWLDSKLGLDNEFLAKMLQQSEKSVSAWRRNKVAQLPLGGPKILRELWHAVMHLLSYFNNEENRVRQLLVETIPAGATTQSELISVENPSPFYPPWIGSSMKSYLESQGAEGIAEVNHWIMSIRFGNPYSTISKEAACL